MRSQFSTISKRASLDVVFQDEFEKRQIEGKLFRAIAEKRFKLARILVEGGVNVNCKLRTGVTPLMIACDQAVNGEKKRMQIRLVQSLLDRKADVNAKDNFGRTAHTYAFLSRDFQLVRLLEDGGSSGWTCDSNVSARRMARDSIIISSTKLSVHFQRWESNDFAENLNYR